MKKLIATTATALLLTVGLATPAHALPLPPPSGDGPTICRLIPIFPGCSRM